MLIRHQMQPMMETAMKGIGFTPPIPRARARKRRHRAVVELVTAAALVVSLAVAVTAVSFGIARAGVHFGDVAIVSVR
jgi:hypothetical protein